MAPVPPRRDPKPEFEKVTIERDDGKVVCVLRALSSS